MSLLLAAGMASSIAGGVIGAAASKRDREKAAQAMAEAQALIDEVGAPPDLSAKIIYQKLEQAGVLTPDVEQAVQLGISKVSQVQEDPELRKAQMSSLRQMQQIGRLGLTPEERAELNQVRQATQRDLEAKRQQIQQNMQARGMAGGGQELAAQLLAAQASADQASAEGDRISAMAFKNALNAISQSGQIGGQIRSQDFDVNKTKAGAEDEFSRFNTEAQIGRQQRNIDRSNVAQEKNLEEKQRIQDTNTEQENRERLRQVEAKRQYWQDKLDYAKARAGARLGSADFYESNADRKASQWANIGSSLNKGFGSLNQNNK